MKSTGQAKEGKQKPAFANSLQIPYDPGGTWRQGNRYKVVPGGIPHT